MPGREGTAATLSHGRCLGWRAMTPLRVNLPPRVPLARLPTPLERSPASARRSASSSSTSATTSPASSSPVTRRASWSTCSPEAEAARADTLVTCGGAQSNHCRATAFAAAKRGLAAIVLLRVPDPSRPPALEANALLDRLAGAGSAGSRDEYRRRAEVMEEVAAELRAAGRRPYVIPEGGSSALGSLGYVAAVDELCAQLPDSWREGR